MSNLDAKKIVIDLFESHDVVLLGEEHGIANNLQFLNDLIPDLAASGVFNIALEFSAEEFQSRSDLLLTAKQFDPQESRDMLFGYNVGWPYVEYQSVHQAAWALNQHSEKKMQLVHPSYVYDWSKWQGLRSEPAMQAVMHRGNYNRFRAKRIFEAVRRGEKLLGLFGAVHAFNDQRNLPEFHLDESFESVGRILQTKHQVKVASILLNSSLTGFWDANIKTSDELERCTIDRDFLKGRDFEEVLANWPDPDWTPAPESEFDYWRIIEGRV